MKEALKKAMTTSISEVLETMFYLTVEISEKNSENSFFDKASKNIHACKLDYTGIFKGYFNILIPSMLLNEITENFLGIGSEDLKKEHIDGTLKEIMNMIAGSVFSHYDESLIFSLGIPEIIPGDSSIIITKEEDDSLFFLVETMEGPLAVGIRFNV